MKRVSLILAYLALPLGAAAAEKVVWTLGKPDGSFREFAIAGDYQRFAASFANGVRYRVGTDQPNQAWPFIHPGPTDAWAGGKGHAFVIEFDLPAAATGSYELRLAYVSTHGAAPPRYRLEINGKTKDIELQPGSGDDALTNPSVGRRQSRAIAFDGALLKAGSNRIALESTGGSWSLYDAIELVHRDTPLVEQVTGVELVPTVLFVRRNGELRRVATVKATGSVLFHGGSVEVSANGRSIKEAVPADPFGTASVEVDLPDADRPYQAKTVLRFGGKELTTATEVKPVRKWKIFVAAASHVDIGYTHLQPETAAIHSVNIDRSVELCKKYPTYRWNTESTWVLQHYLATRKPERIQTMAELTRTGRLNVEAFHSNLLTGLCSDEEMFRSMYHSEALARQFGWPRISATLTDAPSHVWSVPSVLAACGVRYLSMGCNPTRAPLLKHGGLDAKSPVWWQGPDGAKVLAMFHNQYAQAGLVGAHGGLATMKVTVPLLIARFDGRSDYPYDAIHLHGAYSDNVSVEEPMAKAIDEWNQTYAFPQVTLAANHEFFAYLEKQFGSQIPVVRGDAGNYWEDGAASSAHETRINRANARRAIAAEMLWTLLADRKTPYPHARFERIWNNILLYNEHTWGAHNSITHPDTDFVKQQFAIKASYATDAARDIAALLDTGLTRLAGQIGGSGKALVALNPSATAVDELVTLEGKTCRVSVPAFSYRAIPLAELTAFDGRALPATNAVESVYYRVQADPRRVGVVSIVDKQTGRELLDAKSPWLFGQYIYATGGADSSAIFDHLPDKPKFAFTSPKDAVIRVEELGPGSRRLVLEAQTSQTPKLRLEIVLYDWQKRLDFVARFTKTKTYAKEAVYLAFPFAAARPTIDYEVGGAIVRAGADWLPGACKDWFSVQDFVRIRDGENDVVWSSPDAPLVQLCDIQTGKWLKELKLTSGTILSYPLNNYWFTNYQAGQGGEFVFRYSLTSGREIDNAAATRFGRSASFAGLAGLTKIVDLEAAGSLPPQGSILAVDGAGIVLQTLKRAEDNKGVIVRLRETSGKNAAATVRLPLFTPHQAHLCDGLEQPRTPLAASGGALAVKLPPFGTATVRIE